MRTSAATIVILVATTAGCAASADERRAHGHDHGEHGEHGEPGEHGHGDHGGEGAEGGHARGEATVTHRFDQIDRWVERFEDPERDAWQEPDRVLELLALPHDAKVADIGAATGYFPVRFARACTDGIVYGVDVEPGMVNYLNLRARREALGNLLALVCAYEDPRIPEPVNLVFVCDTYHHIDDRIAYFRRVREDDLAPDGRLCIVDFKKGDFPVGPGDDHKLAADAVISELDEAGFELVDRHELRYQYVLILRAR